MVWRFHFTHLWSGSVTLPLLVVLITISISNFSLIIHRGLLFALTSFCPRFQLGCSFVLVVTWLSPCHLTFQDGCLHGTEPGSMLTLAIFILNSGSSFLGLKPMFLLPIILYWCLNKRPEALHWLWCFYLAWGLSPQHLSTPKGTFGLETGVSDPARCCKGNKRLEKTYISWLKTYNTWDSFYHLWDFESVLWSATNWWFPSKGQIILPTFWKHRGDGAIDDQLQRQPQQTIVYSLPDINEGTCTPGSILTDCGTCLCVSSSTPSSTASATSPPPGRLPNSTVDLSIGVKQKRNRGLGWAL